MYVAKDYDDRKNEFLDTALGLFMSRGYEQTSVAAIIEAVGVSKGAFYHYFKTKEDLLDQLSARASSQAMQAIEDVLADPGLNAVERLNAVFARTNAYKAQNRELILTILQVFYGNENLVLRNKLQEQNIQLMTPVIAGILEQGIAEGRMHLDYPRETAAFILRIGSNLVEGLARLLPVDPADDEGVEAVLRHMRMYNQSVERIIGAEPGSLHLVDQSMVEIITGKE
ncbi:MAG: TetR/AcrR family transcriptional regulator [Spirochaeta sp.]